VGQEILRQGPSGRIMIGTKITLWLVEKPVYMLLGVKILPIHGNHFAWANTGTKIAHDNATNFNLTALDKNFTMPTRINTCMGKVLI
jgi:hypothetical protein